MNDLLDRLGGLTSASTGRADASADLARAHAALARRRRTRAAVAGVGLTLALGGSLGVVALTADHGSGRPPMAIGPHAHVRLVDYHGRQLPWFEVAEVPEGYHVQSGDPTMLVLARSGDHTTESSEDKVVVYVEQGVPIRPAGTSTPVRVHGTPGAITSSPAGLSRTLRYADQGFVVEIQAWKTVGLTDAQLVELASGLTLTEALLHPSLG